MWKARHSNLVRPKKKNATKVKKQITRNQKPKENKPWDSSINDLGVYKLSPHELEQRLSERVSKNRVNVPDSEVLKIREEHSKQSSASESRGCEDQEQVAPPGWCLDFEAIAEGLKPPALRNGGRKPRKGGQEENLDPNDGSQREVEVQTTESSSVCEDDSKSSQNDSAQINHGNSSCESNSPMICKTRCKIDRTPEDATNHGNHLDARDRHSAACLQRHTGIKISTKEPTVCSSVSILPEEDCNLPDARHSRDCRSSAQVMRKEDEPWKDSISTLRQEMADMKTQIDDIRGHFTSVLTVVQSQIQQLLRSQKESKPVHPPELRIGSAVPSTDPSKSLGNQMNGSSASFLPGDTNCQESHLPPVAQLGKSMMTSKTPLYALTTQSPVSECSTHRQPDSSGKFGSLPSYAEMRRSEMDMSTGKPNSSMLVLSEGMQRGEYNNTQDTMVNLPAAPASDQQQMLSDSNTRSNYQQASIKNSNPWLHQNVPGPWTSPSALLPPHSNHAPETKASSQDLSSSVSLRAHGTQRHPFYYKAPDASW